MYNSCCTPSVTVVNYILYHFKTAFSTFSAFSQRCIFCKFTENDTDLELSKDPSGFLQDGIHAVCHRHSMFPVVVWNSSVIFPHWHSEATQFLQLKALITQESVIISSTGTFMSKGLNFKTKDTQTVTQIS